MRYPPVRSLATALVLGALTASTAAQTTHVVSTAGNNFVPAEITIEVGDTVRWTDLVPSHNVAEVDCPSTAASVPNGGFYSGSPGEVDEFSVTFTSEAEHCYICPPHSSGGMWGKITVLPADPWVDLGGGTTGSHGDPTLTMAGPLLAGTPLTVDLQDAPPGALMLFWLSFTSTPANFFGGTVYPAVPPNLQLFQFADGAGTLSVGVPWPAGIAPGLELYTQFLIEDPTVIWGITLSNAQMATTP